MARYLQKYVGKYRVIAEYDRSTNDFPRTKDGLIDPSFDDLYISCSYGNKIYHYGQNVLVAYIPSIGRGRHVLRKLKEEYPNVNIFDIRETDNEVEFKFKAKDIDIIALLLKARTSGVKINPFSKKNLRKEKYVIPKEDLALYKEITDVIPQGDMRIYVDMNNAFLQSISTKKHKDTDIKDDIQMSGLKMREYIHKINKWNEYLIFIKNYLYNYY